MPAVQAHRSGAVNAGTGSSGVLFDPVSTDPDARTGGVAVFQTPSARVVRTVRPAVAVVGVSDLSLRSVEGENPTCWLAETNWRDDGTLPSGESFVMWIRCEL